VELHPIWIRLNRSEALEDFVRFAEEHYASYQGEPFRIEFIGEPGIDVGGLTREFFTLISAPLLQRAFTAADNQHLLWLPRENDCDSGRLQLLLAAGFLIRLAAESSQSISSALPLVLFAKLRGLQLKLEDLREISPDVVASLVAARDLCNKGEDIGLYLLDDREVTAELFDQYESEQINSALTANVRSAFHAFQVGFEGLYEGENVGVLSAEEIHARVTGERSVDWAEMKENCQLDGYSLADVPVVLFWSVFDALPEEQKIRMLQFVTSSECAPAQGFANNPIRFCRMYWNPATRGPLPVAHTCFRRLDLPAITDEESMRWALRICIENSQGFGLG
jgi:hypothetical protein